MHGFTDVELAALSSTALGRKVRRRIRELEAELASLMAAADEKLVAAYQALQAHTDHAHGPVARNLPEGTLLDA